MALKQPKEFTLQDAQDRYCQKEMLATTAMYGPWTPQGEFDFSSYESLVRRCLLSGSVPATNVDTTWAIYNDWALTKELIWRTAALASELADSIAVDRPLLVAGLNTNSSELSLGQIAPEILRQIKEIDHGLRERGLTKRIRYMPVPDRRLYDAAPAEKLAVIREIGRVIGDYTDLGFVFFELDIGIPGFGSNYTLEELADIFSRTPEIQEYKSALITQKALYTCVYDFCDDLARLKLIEEIAPQRIQFSTGNDWFIHLARMGKRIDRHGYLLGASQISVELFKMWREFVQAGKPCALALEQDLQAAAKDFWTPGNVGIYRHYIAIFLAVTGQIAHPLPHPRCDSRYIVQAEDYFLPIKHALRLGLLDSSDLVALVRNVVPGWADQSSAAIRRRTAFLN
jgi:hypothetical protein